MYVYAFVRRDMPMANQLVQIGHACLEAGNRFDQPEHPCSLVLLSVECEEQLMRAVEFVEQRGIEVYTFYEPDFPHGCTAACTEPVAGEERRCFRKFRLWR